MPEGPEVLILTNYLKKNILGKKFTEIISNTKTKRELPKPSKVIDVDCYGKLIHIKTEDYYVHIHLGITGWFIKKQPKIYKYVILFGKSKFYLQDRRRFSSINIFSNETDHLNNISKYGIDILRDKFTEAKFLELLSNRRVNICAILMNQKIFAGVGNYIKNDALYLSKISPYRKVNTLSEEEKKNLYDKIIFVAFSNVYDWFKTYKLEVPERIKKVAPKKLQVPYNFYVFDREKDNLNYTVILDKKHCGRRTYYVKEIQK